MTHKLRWLHGVQEWLLVSHLTRDKTAYWRSVLRLRFVLVALTIASAIHFAHEEWWPFRAAKTVAMEALTNAVPSGPAQFVRVVEIDEEAYRTYFTSISPLCTTDSGSTTFNEILQNLVDLKPRVIVVDIDTSGCSLHPPPTNIPIVWARHFTFRNRLNGVPVNSGVENSNIKNKKVGVPTPIRWGYVVYERDPNGYIVDLQRGFSDGLRDQPNLHWAAVLAFCQSPGPSSPVCQKNVDTSALKRQTSIVGAKTGLKGIPVGDIVSLGKAVRKSDVSDAVPSELLSGKVVFLGGSYSPDDIRPTYLGWMPSVEVLAQATEAELSGNMLIEPPSVLLILMDLIVALVLAGIYHYFKPLPALILTLAVFQMLILYAGTIAYSIKVWIDFIPFFAAIWLELLIHSAERSDSL